MSDQIDHPEDYIRSAEARGEIAYAIAVTDLMDRADALHQSGDIDSATRYLKVVASLDVDNKVIADVVDAARRTLEASGIVCEPSTETEYNEYLATLPPHDRHVMLARQYIRRMSSAFSSDDRTSLARQIINNFELAMEYKPLGKKDQRIYIAMKSQTK